MRRFQDQFDQFDQFDLDFVSVDFSEQISAVHSSAVDACIARGPIDASGLRVVKLVSDPRMVMVSQRNPIAGQDSTTMSDLRFESRVNRTNVSTGWRNWWSLDPSPDGESPPYGPSVASFEEQVELAAIDRAISIVPASASYYYHRPDIAFVPISDAPLSEVFLCASCTRSRPGVDALFEVARTAYPDTVET